MCRKERHFQGVTREIRNFPKIIISGQFFVSSNFVSEGTVELFFLITVDNFSCFTYS